MNSTCRELLERAVEALLDGKVIAYPTDTLVGLGVIANDVSALELLYELKERPARLPVSLMLSSTEEIGNFGELSPASRRFIRTALPGPYTVLLWPTEYARSTLSNRLISEQGVIALRVPDHNVAREISRSAGAITSTSANRHGRPPARTIAEAKRIFGNDIAVYLDAKPAPSGVPSTIVDLSGKAPRMVPRT